MMFRKKSFLERPSILISDNKLRFLYIAGYQNRVLINQSRIIGWGQILTIALSLHRLIFEVGQWSDRSIVNIWPQPSTITVSYVKMD